MLVAFVSPALAQSPFEEIHGDILRKLEARRARSSREFQPLPAPQPTPNQLLYDAIHYTIDVAINPTTKLIDGRVLARITPLAGTITSIDFDADNVLTVSGVRRSAGDTLEWVRSTDLLTVSIPAGISITDTITIEILYSGSPNAADDPGLFFGNAGGYPLVYSLSEPWSARSWWPCKDYPDDKATFDLYFSVPISLFAAANGTYLGFVDETRWSASYRRYHWREDYPMTTYLASIAAAKYVRIDDYFVYAPGDTMPVTHYVYPALEANARIDFDITVPALSFFSQTFGRYPFIAEKYGVALCSIGGGMEHQTLTSYGSSLVRGDHYYDWIFVHEMAHMWFGDMITCKDWTHIWLNEGFASYSEALWFEHLQGAARLKTYMESQDHPGSWSGPVLRDPDVTSWEYYFNNVVYDKGAWVLHMLRRVIGDEAFFQILKDYCADPRYRFSAAETDDFRLLCEARYGAPLSWFFDEWLTRQDRLSYQWSSDCYRLGDAFNLTITVDQMQDALYTMPVDFSITTAAGTIDTVLWINDRHEEIHLAFADSALAVVFDPDHWILCDKSMLVPTDAAVRPIAFLSQNFPNPFNPTTTINYQLPQNCFVTIKVFDMLGKEVSTLVNESKPAGYYEVDFNGGKLTSGVYIYRLQAGSFTENRKLVLRR